MLYINKKLGKDQRLIKNVDINIKKQSDPYKSRNNNKSKGFSTTQYKQKSKKRVKTLGDQHQNGFCGRQIKNKESIDEPKLLNQIKKKKSIMPIDSKRSPKNFENVYKQINKPFNSVKSKKKQSTIKQKNNNFFMYVSTISCLSQIQNEQGDLENIMIPNISPGNKDNPLILQRKSKKKQRLKLQEEKPKLEIQVLSTKHQRINNFMQELGSRKKQSLLKSTKAYSNQNTLNQSLQKQQKNVWNLSQDQLKKFGDRFPSSFNKIKLLGRGGFSIVWLGMHQKTKELFAIKQILTKNSHQTHLKEIWLTSFFLQANGQAREQFQNHPGIDKIVKMYSYDIRLHDTWLFYQLCDQTLGNALYQLKGQYNKNNQKVYRIKYKFFYNRLANNLADIKFIIIQLSKVLYLLSQHNIVHSDIKTENILLKWTKQKFAVKLIDYGSSFLFTNLKHFSMATPEYMAPQILNYILFQNNMEYNKQSLKIIKNYKNNSAVDIWSLGCVILQLISGLPLWMSLKTLVKKQNGQEIMTTGLFAVKERKFSQIIKRQIEQVQNLQELFQKKVFIDDQCFSGIRIDSELKTVLGRMLQLDPNKRIRPEQILQFFKVDYSYSCELK